MKRWWLSATLVVAAIAVAGMPSRLSAAGTGAIQGHVRLSGPAPGNPVVRMGVDPMCASLNAGPRRPVQNIVERAADGGLANAFVTLAGTFPKMAPPKT